MKKFFLAFLFSLFITLSYGQSSMPGIAGWKMEEQNNRYRLMPAAGNGKSFIYEVMPLQRSNGGAGSSWFKEVVNSDVQQTGYTIPAGDNARVNENSGFYNYTTQVTDKQGKKWLVAYIGYQLNDGEYRLCRMISFPDNNYFKINIKPAIAHFGKLAKQDGIVIKSIGSGTDDKSTERKTSTSTSSPRIRPEELVTEKGLKPAELKGIAINLEYTIGVGGGVIPTYEPYLMLADGSIYSDPIISPYKFDVAKSKQLEPKKWGTWKAVGKTIVINWPSREKNRSETWEDNWFWARPATNGEKITGSYNTISGGGNTALGGNVMVVSAKDITLNKNGQFTMTSMGGGSNSGDMGVSSTAYAHKDAAGTYMLNGFSMELRYNNGQVEQRAFYFYPDSKDVFGIGTRVYTSKSK